MMNNKIAVKSVSIMKYKTMLIRIKNTTALFTDKMTRCVNLQFKIIGIIAGSIMIDSMHFKRLFIY